MSLRVTQSMMNARLLSNITGNMNRMNTLQDQLSSGKRINKPSDDPVGLTFAMRYRSELQANEQYERNVDAATSLLEYTDTTMGEAVDVLHRVRELMVSGANGTLPQDALNSISTELKQLHSQLVEIGNSQFNGKFMYNGEQTQTAPYLKRTIDEAAAVTPAQLAADPTANYLAQNVTSDTGQIKYELSPSMVMAVNVTGNEFFGNAVVPGNEASSDNVFNILSQAINAMDAGDSDAVSELIGKVDSRMSTMLEKRSEVGARMNRIELITARLQDNNINLQTVQSKAEDADMAQVITNLKMEENVYQASLSAGAQIIRPSLVDFLR
ncbi:flagellar hook-associated protein FlgL [Paenibacillus methanolicus]|uniref:Flagellar hook-associated protein 3 FlgL n=1 Tax=Paenibacillus methanolicus TaxID=582686 RepID=A0A5S5CCJ7_9BACL|nr:flagellar hook-associated protein FlgL [Paenibacillus methanolicus]TYP75723.1 flagellar hook-associated protein 3 FlgL [Paenibacillus methanolicus]